MIDGQLDPASRDAMVQGYIRYSEARPWEDHGDAQADGEHPDYDARWALEDAIREAPAAAAWELVLTLLRGAPDEILEDCAVGPLENLVVYRGTELIDEIEREARQDPRFRWALGCIWLSYGELPDDILTRVVRASGGEIHPLPPLNELVTDGLDLPFVDDH